jgi:hypothetical protein
MIEGTNKPRRGRSFSPLSEIKKKPLEASFTNQKVRKAGKSKIMPGIEEQGVTTRGTHSGEQLMAQSKEQRVGNT